MKLSNRFYSFCGILMLVSEIWKQWTLTFILNHGSYSWWHFPFQLCSIPMYVCLAIGVLNSPRIRKHSPFLDVHADRICSLLMAFLMDFGMLGGIFTFFDTSGMHYDYLPLTIHSFAWHILLIFIGCFTGLNPKADHTWRGFCFSTALYLICCLAATIFNLLFYQFGVINMFYISPHYYMHQKVFHYITDTFGNGYGIAAYITASVIGGGLFHLMWKRISDSLSIKRIIS
ncbi:MAG: YwaF family protein [Eubacteriales bacterium]|nr:YwaF family protein [Eubacteriales bacterium]